MFTIRNGQQPRPAEYQRPYLDVLAARQPLESINHANRVNSDMAALSCVSEFN
ncbi:hypothetical protein ID144_19865 [Pseudomonas sp. JM0905a]|uniref:hypothetical protein n=1 Tax=Pseudomonas sp. JM0905a TaxID=2772484 RepID=UPI00168678A4|nr:hypothetical protein [Pseudomonas sp. JM0905a]MBD2839298.1 hypothetical protein [Pseudomonas sp. JM0905a]